MKRIMLLGEMAVKFGPEFSLDVATPAEAVRALAAQITGFDAYLYQAGENGIEFELLIDNDESLGADQIELPFRQTFVLTPVPVGAGAAGRIIAGVVLIAVAVFTGGSTLIPASMLIAAGASMILSGVVMLLTPMPKTPNESDKKEGKDSFLFSRAAGTSDQGIAVPLLYGRMLVEGMAILSSSISVDEILDEDDDEDGNEEGD